MNSNQKGKLERYFKNSRRFLWRLGRGNQKKTYGWLWGKGVEFENGPYAHVTGQLLNKYGIESLIDTLIAPRVKELFTPSALDFLRSCWYTGMVPDPSFMSTYNISDPSPFLDVNYQYKFVEGWGEFAGIWFEEIEPALSEAKT